MAGAALLTLLATPAFADVVSAAPDAVSVTVYRDQPQTAEQLRQASDDDTSGLTLVSETRTVDLPAGVSRVRFEGVADSIIPASAALQGLPGRLVERNFDYDLLDPAALIEKSVGGEVTIRRTNPRTGKLEETQGVLRSGPDGVVVQTADGAQAIGCGAGPEALVFDHLPAGLSDHPTLSVTADAPAAGRYQLTLSYLAVRIAWSADYVARIAPDGRTLDLTGWLTLANRSGMSFVAAPTAVVAGDVNRVDPDLPDISPKTVDRACWPMGTTSDWRRFEAPMRGMLAGYDGPAGSVSEVVVTAEKRQENIQDIPVARTSESQLGDYRLYTLAEPTTLAARQTKQVRFLDKRRVRFDRLYVEYSGADADDAPDEDAPAPRPALMVLSLENKPANGLGVGLPAGAVSMRQTQDGRDLYIGQRGLRDVPVGEPFELAVGLASDVQVVRRIVSQTTVGAGNDKRDRMAVTYTITNDKPAPVTYEVRQDTERDDFRIAKETRRHTLKNGQDVWRFRVPANGSATLGYTIETAS